jgi:hypothetical protein
MILISAFIIKKIKSIEITYKYLFVNSRKNPIAYINIVYKILLYIETHRQF